jgi:GT2 family glycosyltransferase
MYRGDGSLATSCGRFPSPARLWRFTSLWYNPQRQKSFLIQGIRVWRGDYVEGSFLLTRASAWRELGGIDERNFMYGDDVEYCRSLLELGFISVQCPSVRYTHFGGYDHSRMGYLFAGFRRYHRKFSSRRTQLAADFVLRTGLLLRIPWYWLRAAIQKDNNSRSALRHAWVLNQTWKQSTGG